MNIFLLSRSLGQTSHETFARAQVSRLVRAIQPGDVRFDSAAGAPAPSASSSAARNEEGEDSPVWAHKAGVNALTIDPFEGRYMLSGGADSSVRLWDLDQEGQTYKPVTETSKSTGGHRFGITHLSFYAFDSLAYLSSSYDHTLKISSTETLQASASFDLGSVVYSHALSPIASHLLVATATQHPAVRLVDLRSGASTHSLVGHGGAVLTVAWSPRTEHVLASGGVDGTIRLWDIRRSAAGDLGVLDQEDSVGIVGYNGRGMGARPRGRGKAHGTGASPSAVNGLTWTENGNYLVSTGHDARIRVWNASTGANTLTNFGPIVRNSQLATMLPLLAPTPEMLPPMTGSAGPHASSERQSVMFFPNERDILMLDMFEGCMLQRLRAPGTPFSMMAGDARKRNRVSALAWRAGSVEMYSSHTDGTIRAWKPRTSTDEQLDRDEKVESKEPDDRKRKRQVLDDVYQDLFKEKITFG